MNGFSILMYSLFIVMGVTSGVTPLFGRHSTPFGVAITGKHEHEKDMEDSE